MPGKRSRSESNSEVENQEAQLEAPALDNEGLSGMATKGDENSSILRAMEEITDLKKRNRRMFGALMGHLGVAKRHLESESTQTLLQKQQQISAIVKLRNEEESRRVKQIQLENARKERLLRREAVVNLKIRTMKKATAAWKEMTLPLANFLMTNVPPGQGVNLAWLPAVHSKKTKAMLEQRRQQVESLIRDREERESRQFEVMLEDARRGLEPDKEPSRAAARSVPEGIPSGRQDDDDEQPQGGDAQTLRDAEDNESPRSSASNDRSVE